MAVMIDRVKYQSLADGCVKIGGIVGRRIDRCIDNRVATQAIEPLIAPYRDRSDGPNGFRGEFWGKWFTSLVLAHSYRPSNELAAKMRQAVDAMLATQTEDGCISTYPDHEQHGMWDTWSRKYALMGLLDHHEATGDGDALAAACRMTDHFARQLFDRNIHLPDTGHWAWEGLPPSSILEPVAMLHRITGEQRYLELAESIVASWDQPSKYLPDGLRLIDKALAGLPPREVGNPKAYEQMSCFEGLCELYETTGEARYVEAAIALARSIRRHERTIVGSGCNHEMWCETVRHQTNVLEQPLETCATVTWMKLCHRLLRLTGEPVWADELEVSLFNALAAAMMPTGEWWSYYSALVGERVASHFQYDDVGLSCCVANGPRALLLTHRWAVMQDDAGPVVNLYAPGEARLTAPDGAAITIEQQTDYPIGDTVRLTVHTDGPSDFNLRLRLPAWSERTVLQVNGESIDVSPGRYASVQRTWRDGDQVTLTLDMRARAVAAPSGSPHLAVRRGPVVLALDSRLTEPDRRSLRLVVNEDGTVDATVTADDDRFDLLCDVPFVHHKVHIVKESATLRLCDYASAGNDWSAENLFRVWLAQPLFMQRCFVPDTWQLMFPDAAARPTQPACRNDF